MKAETLGTSQMITPPFGFPGTPVLSLLLVVTALIEEKRVLYEYFQSNANYN